MAVLNASIAAMRLPRRLRRAAADAPAAAGGDDDVIVNEASIAERAWWTLSGCALINWSVQLLTATTNFSWVAVLVVLAGAWGLATVIASWAPGASAAVKRLGGVFGWATALLLVATFATWALVQVHNAPGYGTDELAFDQYAGQLALHGLNPYLHSMAPSFSLFRVSPDGYTYTLSGSAVTQLSYPALAFLLYVPFLALGWTSQLAVALNVAAWALTVLLIYAVLPKRLRPVALVLGSVAVYVSYSVGGITDVLFIPLLVGAAYRWDRFGTSWRTYSGPVLLGLAMSIKQTPWLLLPFILCALAIDEHTRSGVAGAVKRSARYLAAVVVAFLIPNVAYIAVSPAKWWDGVVTPVASHLVPAGQGAIALSLFMRWGGGSLAAFTLATVLLAVLLLVLYVDTYPLLRPATFILPALALFFASRSYGNYLVGLIPAAVVAAATVERRQSSRSLISARRRAPTIARRWRAASGVCGLLFLAAVVYAFSSSQPLRLRVTGIRTTGQLATIEQVSLRVTNTTGSPIRPAFTLDEGGGITTFWHATSGPSTLAARHSANYTIVSPNFPAQPSIAGGFSVVAFSQSPAAVSATGPYKPSSLHVGLMPDAVNQVIRVGQPVVVRAQLLDALDQPVHQANVPVYLNQIIYNQSGLELSEAAINNEPPGQTPVMTHTNANGVATFTIIGTQASPDPVYFEANIVQTRDFYPYGYSEILPVRFGS